jgi:hypothetical protein
MMNSDKQRQKFLSSFFSQDNNKNFETKNKPGANKFYKKI